MLTSKQEALLVLLSSSYGTAQGGDAAAILAAYEMALAQLPEQDIDAAFEMLVAGTAPGQNTNFMPAAPFVGGLVRNIRDGRLQREFQHRSAVKQIEGRDITKELSPLKRMDVVNERLVRSPLFKERSEPTIAEKEALHVKSEEYRRKHDAFFQINMSDAAIARRLGFSSGDPDGDAA